MKPKLLSPSCAGNQRVTSNKPSPSTGRLRIGLAVVLSAAALVSAQAQIQTAGTLFINVDATTLTGANGTAVADIANSGTLGGYFEGSGTYVTNANGVFGLGFPGGSTSPGPGYMQLKNSVGGSLIVPPSGLVGASATCSIEVWALNPQVADDECMISWGARTTGQNMAFEYGRAGSGGAQHNGSGNDIQWDSVLTGGGAPLNGYWHHLAYTCDGSTQRLYCDGVLVNSQAIGAYNTATSAGLALGAQWNGTGTAISTSPGFATLVIGRVRVHDGVLSDSQVLNNFNYEKGSFLPTLTAAYLNPGPIHRYSFSEPATADASGATIHDSVGTAHGIVYASPSNNIPQLTGRRVVLPGGVQTQIPGYGAPYVALPAGLVSGQSTYHGGSGALSIEIWYKNKSLPYSWCRVFDIGSCGFTAGQLGQQVTGAGNYPPGYVASGYGYLDTFAFATQNGGNVDRHQLLWQNLDMLPQDNLGNYTATNTQINANVHTLGSFSTDMHLVVTWDEGSSNIVAYENGLPVAGLLVPTNMTAINDVNVWLGRSMSGSDGGFDGEFDEVRFYNYALSPAQVYGDYLTGPNTINTGAQAATIITQPQSQTVNQGWPVSFYVEASGSPAVSYQWYRGATALAGATTDTYALQSPTMANNGDQYSCVVSNNTGSPHAVTSSTATLTVTPNVASPFIVFHETKDANPAATGNGIRDNYDGTVGALFKTGAGGAVVTHLGMYDVYGAYGDGLSTQTNGPGLQTNHLISIYSGDGATLMTSAMVPMGTTAYLYKGYRYVPLPSPLVLAGNSNYILQADVYNGEGDMWPDGFYTGSWDPYFVGNNGPTTRILKYGSHGQATTGGNTPNAIYGAPNMASLPLGAPVVATLQAGVTQYVNLSATLGVAANGQAPLTVQWYKVGPPDTALPGQNGLSLVFPSLASTDQGSYYAIASNGQGTATSANIYLRVFADTAVSITQQPTNTTVLEGYSASFYLSASGTPPIGYQWQRNSTPISGATLSSYTLPVTYGTNNGDVFTCVVSNYANGGPHTLTSSGATLTVTPNQAPVPEVLYPTVVGSRDTYSGSVGGIFQVGAVPVKVTHLGYYCAGAALNYPGGHHVGIFSGDGSSLLVDVVVSGSGDVIYDSYAYVALPTPLTLAANTSYILAAEVISGSGDPWPDIFEPSAWNPYFVGNTLLTSRVARYSAGGATWPTPPLNGNVTDSIYGAPNLAVLPAGPPVVTMDQTAFTQYTTSNLTMTAFVNGQAPLTVQWYKVGSPDVALPGQTSSTLFLNNLQMSDAGTYYLKAANSAGTVQGPNATLTVLPSSPPNITVQPQSQSVYIHQPATFTVAASVPPSSYQWWFNGNPITGATTNTYPVVNADATKAGNYKATLANTFGTSTSAVAVLTVFSPAAGSYPDTVLTLNPLVYYRFSDLAAQIAAGTSNVFNMGSLGTPNNGTVQGTASSGAGPQPPTWPNFEASNPALVLDPATLDVDVAIPALNLDPNNGPNMTFAAWINPSGQQEGYAGIIFYRGAGGASGLGIKTDTTSGNDMLEYHWANNYYGFNSYLFTPMSGTQWAFVALAVDPNQAILYLNDGTGMQSATNVAAHGGVSLAGTTYVGWDDNDIPTMNLRRFAGSIDEPMIFGRTLSPDEITALYQAGSAVKIQVARSGANLVLTWSTGVLQQASDPAGTYSDVSGAVSPYTLTPGPGQQFFRIRVQ